MIKKNLKKIIIIMLIIVICTSLGAYATTYILNATEVEYTKANGTTVQVNQALDELKAKSKGAWTPRFSQGQEVTYKSEPFYVLYETKDTVTLFAKTNINKDCTAQANATYDQTAVAFCSSGENSSYSSLVSPSNLNMNLNNINGFSDTSAIGRARKYARNKGTISGRLLTYEEANSLKDTYPEMIYGYGNTSQSYSGHGFENYLLGSVYSDSSGLVWYVIGHDSSLNGRTFGNGNNPGVRPVIEVYKSEVT